MDARIRKLEHALTAQTARADDCEGLVAAIQRAHPRQRCADAECELCGVLACPSREPLHFHHDGCPACNALGEISTVQAAERFGRRRRLAGDDHKRSALGGAVYELESRRRQTSGASFLGKQPRLMRYAQAARSGPKSSAGHHPPAPVPLASEHAAPPHKKETPR